MKRLFKIIIVMVSLFSSLIVFAEDNTVLKGEEQLKFSISSLKESADKVRLENKKLVKDIKNIPRKIKKLQKEMEALEDKKLSFMNGISKSEGEDENEKRERSFIKANMDRFKNKFEILSKEEEDISNELSLKEKQIQQMKEEMGSLTKQIQSLENKFGLLDKSEQIRMLKEEEQHLQDLIKESEDSLQDLYKELSAVRNKNAKPLEEVKALERQQDIWKQKLAIAGDEYNVAAEEGQKLQNDIDAAKENNANRLKQLNEEILELKKKRENFKSTLSLAKQKLSGRTITSATFQEEETQLKKTLDTIRDEKEKLSNEIRYLQDEIKELDKH